MEETLHGDAGVGLMAARWTEGGQVYGSAASCFETFLVDWFWQGHLCCSLPRELYLVEVM